MSWPLTIGLSLYALLAVAGQVLSGVPTAYYVGVIQPALRGTPTRPKHERTGWHHAHRLAAVAGLVLVFALIVVVLSPMSVYRALWELWRWARGSRSPQPPREPAVAKRVKAA